MLFAARLNNCLASYQRNACTVLLRFCGSSSAGGKNDETGKVMKVLNVAEKNDAAKNIAGYLSRGNSRRRDGLSVYNKIYEFKTRLWGQDCDMVMTSVSGHLLGYEFVGQYRQWHGCNPLSLFDAPVVKQCSEDYVKIKKTLEREVRSCGALIIWTDCDREGENIGFEVIQVCQDIKPTIRVYRAKFSEITQTSVDRALQTVEAPNKAISDAVDVRSELDLRIGAAFTRFQTLRLQKVFPQTLSNMLISYGSCQFPTLGFVVERFLAIDRFQPEPFWRIKVLDVRDELSVEFKWDRNRLFERLPCQVFLDMCQEHPDATVEKVTSKPKSKWRPLPLDTVELEKLGSRKLKLNAKQTMKIAEKLYTSGFISYPRTETNIFPKELRLEPLIEQQTADPQWGQFAQLVLQDGSNPRQGKKSDQAHPPIHPTKYTDTLRGDEARVYEFIVRHFLACMSRDAQGHETIVNIDIAGEKFIASGLQIIAKNYLEVYVYEKWNAKEIHAYEQGQLFRPSAIEMVDGETSPPNLLTEADLIALMDKHGIGTDATHAEHIDTIKSRQYVGLKDGQYFVPGKLGIGLVMGYDNMGFQMSKPNLRAELENDLKLICEGQKDPAAVLKAQIDKYREVFRVAIEQANQIDTALAQYLEEQPVGAQNVEVAAPVEDIVVFKCPKCGSNMTLKDRRNGEGKYISCMAYPTCTNNPVWFPPTVEGVEVLNEICNECPGDLPKLKFKLRRAAFPILGTIHETCLGGCDPMFNDLLNIRSESVRGGRGANNDSGFGSLNGTEARTTQGTASSKGGSANRGATNARTTQGTTSRGGSSANRGANPTNDSTKKTSSDKTNTVGFVSNQNGRTYNTTGRTNTQASNNRGNNSTLANIGTSSYSRSSTGPAEHNRSIADDSPDWGNADGNTIFMCKCHENAIQLTVRKDGPNKGRLFYKCAKPQGSGCDFFLWASDSADPSHNTSRVTSDQGSWGANTMTNSWGTNNSTNNWSDKAGSRADKPSWGNQKGTNDPSTSWGDTSSGDIVSCTCGQPAKKLTVFKDGPNKGRLFYSCPQGRGSPCNFFKWADEIDDGAAGSNSWGGGGGDGGRGSKGGAGQGRGRGAAKPRKAPGAGGKRKCGICGVEGHTRKTCPQNVMD